MALLAVPNTFSSGAVIIASQHNTNFSTIYSDYSGNIENVNISATAAIVYSKLALTGAILNADLAGSITDSKLSQITTAAKVSGAAITLLTSLPSGAGVIPTANLGSGTANSTTFLRGDQTYASPVSSQAFYSSGTFVAPTGVTKVFITAVGGGAGGGANTVAGGGGGGGGGAGATVSDVPYTVIATNSYTVTVGAKGTGGAAGAHDGNDATNTSFDSTIIANGGKGGKQAPTSTGGAAGAGTTNSLAASGGTGGGGSYVSTAGGASANGLSNVGGGGGGTPYGAGGAGGVASSGARAGSNAVKANSGAGGGGGGSTDTASAGGDGADGYCLVRW